MLAQTLRVTSIRSQSPKGFGGCIFTGKPIDDHGNVQDTAAYYVVKASGPTLGKALVQPGQWWQVSGEAAERVLDVNGYRVSEWQIDATRALLLRPSGEHIVSFMADNTAFEGIGQVKARKLWDTFGIRLYEALDAADVDVLAAVLTPVSAMQVVSGMRSINRVPCAVGRGVIEMAEERCPAAAQRPGNVMRQGSSAS